MLSSAREGIVPRLGLYSVLRSVYYGTANVIDRRLYRPAGATVIDILRKYAVKTVEMHYYTSWASYVFSNGIRAQRVALRSVGR